MKRTLSLVLALVMVLGSFGAVFGEKADLTEVVEAGAFLDSVGVLEGNDDGDLMLDKTLLRRDMVVLLSRLMQVEETAAEFPSEDVLTFEDITDPYYNGYIAWSVSNKLIEGHSEKVFGFNENVTAQQYSTVLMRALGYEVDDVAYATILKQAADLGLWEGLELENDTEILRGQMAVMTVNALGTKMKDSEKTLAEELGIEMPEEKVLEVVEVYSENLVEVVVELSNAKLAEVERLEDTNNYRVDGKVAERITIDGNNVIVGLEKALDEDKSYDLKIRNIDNKVDGTYKFTVRDNAIPRVEEVEALGEYGIKVMLSEPVEEVQERDFLIDGRNVSMKTEQYGRVLILTPYSGSFSTNAEELTIEALTDFAGYKSARAKFDIEIVKDTVAPVVTDVVVKGDVVEVTFDKDIYKKSVDGYDNRSDVGNISYREGRRDFYADATNKDDRAVKTDYNKVEYMFKDELPRNATVTIEGVQNHSKVAMEKTTEVVREVLDYTEPEVIDEDVKTTKYVEELNGDVTATVKVELTFNKDVKDSNSKDVDNASFLKEDGKLFKDHFAVYQYGEVLRSNDITEDVIVKSVKYEVDGTKTNKDVVIVEFEFDIAKKDVKDDEFDYVLEVKNFEDAKSSRNRMFRYYVDIEVDEEEDFEVKSVKLQDGRRRDEREIVIRFNKEVEKRTTDVLENYTFTSGKGNKDLDDLDGTIRYQRGNEEVVLVIGDYNDAKLQTLTLSRNIKDEEDGNRLTGENRFNLLKTNDKGEQEPADPVVDPDAPAAITYINEDSKPGLVTLIEDADNKIDKVDDEDSVVLTVADGYEVYYKDTDWKDATPLANDVIASDIGFETANIDKLEKDVLVEIRDEDGTIVERIKFYTVNLELAKLTKAVASTDAESVVTLTLDFDFDTAPVKEGTFTIRMIIDGVLHENLTAVVNEDGDEAVVTGFADTVTETSLKNKSITLLEGLETIRGKAIDLDGTDIEA